MLVAWRHGGAIETRARSAHGAWGPTRRITVGRVDARRAEIRARRPRHERRGTPGPRPDVERLSDAERPFVALAAADGSFAAPEAVRPGSPSVNGEALAFSPLTERPTLVWTQFKVALASNRK